MPDMRSQRGNARADSPSFGHRQFLDEEGKVRLLNVE
jgi:hypothetical protein